MSATPGDELLRWASEAGSGSWERMRDVCAFISQKHGLQRRPWTLASGLSALGHVDIDWTTRVWSIAPLALNVVPGLGLCLVLTGSRPYYVDRRFDDATDDLDVFPFELPQTPWPAAKFAKCASLEVAELVAGLVGASLVIDPAASLVDALRPVDEVAVELCPEPPLEEAVKFDPDTLQWVRCGDLSPGLYRVDLHGRPVHRQRLSDGSWIAVDLAVGQFIALQGRGAVLRWRRPDGATPSALELRTELSLPVLAERAATVSSGLHPKVHDGWRRFPNVPLPIARGIADALLQPLQLI